MSTRIWNGKISITDDFDFSDTVHNSSSQVIAVQYEKLVYVSNETNSVYIDPVTGCYRGFKSASYNSQACNGKFRSFLKSKDAILKM